MEMVTGELICVPPPLVAGNPGRVTPGAGGSVTESVKFTVV